jgi:hypothetical protein
MVVRSACPCFAIPVAPPGVTLTNNTPVSTARRLFAFRLRQSCSRGPSNLDRRQRPTVQDDDVERVARLFAGIGREGRRSDGGAALHLDRDSTLQVHDDYGVALLRGEIPKQPSSVGLKVW